LQRAHSAPPSTLFPYTTLFRSLVRRLHAAERVARVGRIRDQAAAAQHVARAAHEPQLRVGGMDGKELRHQVRRNASISRATASGDRKSTRLNSSHVAISYAVFC